MTNKSGGDLTQGAVVVIDATTAASFTTTTTSGFTNGAVGVILEPNGIANNATGLVAFSGWIPKVNLSGAASLGDLFKTHTVAGQAVRHASPAVQGDCGMVLATGTTPTALLFGQPVPPAAAGNVATDAIWDAAGDLAVGTGANTAARMAQGADGRMLGVSAASALGYYGGAQLIQDQLLGADTGDITFSSIPGDFRHLYLLLFGRGTQAANGQDVYLQFNDDTGGNYDTIRLYANVTSPAAAEALAAAQANIGGVVAANGTANVAGAVEAIIWHYANTTFHKLGNSRGVEPMLLTTENFYIWNNAWRWRSTSAITKIKLYPAAGNFLAGTMATLYGLSI